MPSHRTPRGPSLPLRSGPPPRASRRPAAPLLVGLALGTVATAAAVVGLVPVTGAGPVTTVLAAAPAAAPAPDDRLPACDTVVGSMTPREGLAQRLMIGVDAADPAGAAEEVAATQPGGIFLGGNATDLLTGQALRRLQASARVPVTVAVDDEGGRVQRVDELDGDLPSAREMAELPPGEVRALAAERGEALAGRGVTMDIAPVVDLGGQPRGAVIGDRSFGEDPAVVTEYALAFARGLDDAGVASVVKHFPGHGRADGDSHAGRVTAPPLDDLRAADLRPYADLVGPGGPLAGGGTAVMVGHLDVPGLTTDLPSSLTPAVYALLRDEIGFDGLVMTDDLGAMDAITETFDLPRAVVAALAAGADMALWSNPDDPEPVLSALEQALSSGELDPAAHSTATARVLRSKGACA
ncbi:MAG: glycoside hydrolase family 3 protein [Pseudonocardiales bacterium]|nr:glycoside hydrolase family 3 protein [Pseudonocardiales bacterium]